MFSAHAQRWILSGCMLAFVFAAGCAGEKAAESESEMDAPAGISEDTAADMIVGNDSPNAMEAAAPEMVPGAEIPIMVPEAPVASESASVPRAASIRQRSASAIESSPEFASAAGESSPTDVDVGQPSVEVGGTGPFGSLPAGATHHAEKGFATVAVYYATDRLRDSVPLSNYSVSGNRDALVLLVGSSLAFFGCSVFYLLRSRGQIAASFAIFGGVSSGCALLIVLAGTANFEKHGVQYTTERGELVRGICEVTVPDNHDRGVVERPSLLRFEVREDQREHIVLTSATELSPSDFHRRLAGTVSQSPSKDVMVFIHGYNVDFESAVRRTAQLAVDLPFEGVPICYSWPSQGRLLAYTVDENNASWTQSHLKQFLLEVARQSGADSINVIAHSMGNRPATGAMLEIGWETGAVSTTEDSQAIESKPFDRVVLAAPDVDADRFRRDLAPVLTRMANHVTLYASSDDRALIASKQVHGYPRAGESGEAVVVVPGIETVDVSGIDLSLLGHSYYGDSDPMLEDLYQVIRDRLPAPNRPQLVSQSLGRLTYWKLRNASISALRRSSDASDVR